MINKQKMSQAAGSASRPKDASQAGNSVEEGDGLKGMEFNPLKRRPYWQDPEKTIKADE